MYFKFILLSCWLALPLNAMTAKDKQVFSTHHVLDSTIDSVTRKFYNLTPFIHFLGEIDVDKDQWRVIYNNESILHVAATNALYQEAALALAYGANVEALSNRGRTPVLDAVAKDDVSMVRLLIAYGANLNAKTASGVTVREVSRRYKYTYGTFKKKRVNKSSSLVNQFFQSEPSNGDIAVSSSRKLKKKDTLFAALDQYHTGGDFALLHDVLTYLCSNKKIRKALTKTNPRGETPFYYAVSTFRFNAAYKLFQLMMENDVDIIDDVNVRNALRFLHRSPHDDAPMLMRTIEPSIMAIDCARLLALKLCPPEMIMHIAKLKLDATKQEPFEWTWVEKLHARVKS